MHRYTCSCILNLTTTLLQKLAMFYMWNVKQKDDVTEQNILHYCYGDYVTTNQQTQISKTCCRNFTFQSFHIVGKNLPKLIICCWISLSLVKVLFLEK